MEQPRESGCDLQKSKASCMTEVSPAPVTPDVPLIPCSIPTVPVPDDGEELSPDGEESAT